MVNIELYKTIITVDAEEELKEIYYYIKVHLKEEVIARKLIYRIQKEIFDLEYMPKKYKVLKKNKRKEYIKSLSKTIILFMKYMIIKFTSYIFFIQGEIT